MARPRPSTFRSPTRRTELPLSSVALFRWLPQLARRVAWASLGSWPTPVTDGQRVYAWFGNGQLVALDINGRVVWSRHLGTEHAPFKTQWGHGSSPTLHGDLLILLCDHLSDAYLLAVDARTGKERWKVERGDGRV